MGMGKMLCLFVSVLVFVWSEGWVRKWKFREEVRDGRGGVGDVDDVAGTLGWEFVDDVEKKECMCVLVIVYVMRMYL